jgi:hypothetical protein
MRIRLLFLLFSFRTSLIMVELLAPPAMSAAMLPATGAVRRRYTQRIDDRSKTGSRTGLKAQRRARVTNVTHEFVRPVIRVAAAGE